MRVTKVTIPPVSTFLFIVGGIFIGFGIGLVRVTIRAKKGSFMERALRA